MTKENIIIAALRLFVTRGYKSVSLTDVAKEVSITKGGIYHYFSSKDALLQVGMHYLLDRLEAKYTELLSANNSMQDVLTALLVEKMLERYAKDLLGVEGDCRVDCAHFVIEIMSKFPDIQARMEQGRLTVCAAFAKKIEAAMEQGELKRGLDSYAVAAIIMATVNGQLSLGRFFQSLEMRNRMLENVWLLLTI
ncbi:HTH-type transcriptional regulator TtgR [Sporomusa ovata DSM 2662]|uniref:Transcriptional regulator, TetR family n=1 Tax=Sporomusa ovata TaxID=2378 RepID=A0A0U1L2F4_9FIRM|nr:TetR/AcrR family transcriptional regulator [Sporomusa ovata]EQB27261.1 transcriptional regulator, TetR family [Sporomusa ovata DSM 2662]CQR73104.1 Transcriptional regulator, TetR family [Sporomusa ovata]